MQSLAFTPLTRALAFVRVALSFVCHLLAFACDSLALISEPISLVSEPLAPCELSLPKREGFLALIEFGSPTIELIAGAVLRDHDSA